MAVLVAGVEPDSPAAKVGVHPGEVLLRIGKNEIRDVLDYRFYMIDCAFSLVQSFLRKFRSTDTVTP